LPRTIDYFRSLDLSNFRKPTDFTYEKSKRENP